MAASPQDPSTLPEIDAVHQQEIDQTVRALRSRDPHVRVEAVRVLGKLKAGPDVLLPALSPRLPPAVLEQAPAILSALEAWQAGLPELARGQSVEEIAAEDRALTLLIGILEG